MHLVRSAGYFHRVIPPLVAALVWAGAASTRADYPIIQLASVHDGQGTHPEAGVIFDSAGNLYGTTVNGGQLGTYGNIFEVAAGTHQVTSVAEFTGNGAYPYGSLLLDHAGNLYGTTYAGGANGYGTVFEVAAGSHTISILASFNGSNGAHPYDKVVLDSAGNLWGTTYYGGNGFTSGQTGYGTVFEVAAGTHVLSNPVTFNSTNGQNPYGGLITDAAGNFYGTTSSGGGANHDGTVFEINAGNNSLTTLATFGTPLSANGSSPYGDLVLDAAGNLYGTTWTGGGSSEAGTVFKVAAGTHTLTAIATFLGSNGAMPYAGLVMDGAGNLYGTTSHGGANSDGTVFEVTAGTHALITLVNCDANENEPLGSLVFDGSGNLYGTSYAGGVFDYGTVFEVVIPEPASLVVLSAAVLGMKVRRRRSESGSR